MIKLGNLKEHIGKEVEVQAFVDNTTFDEIKCMCKVKT